MSTNTPQAPAEDPMNYLYTKSFNCPVCENEFMDFAIRRSKLRSVGTDRDLRTRYMTIDPNLYDILLCNYCGYANLAGAFPRITSKQQAVIKEKITPAFKYMELEVPFTPAGALARYKQALACCNAIEAKASQKAMICLKMAWIFRDANDEKSELVLLKLAHSGLKQAYTSEDFPLAGLDEPSAKYIMAELGRRLGDMDDALKLVGELIVSRATPTRIKDMAQDIKDMIREQREAEGQAAGV